MIFSSNKDTRANPRWKYQQTSHKAYSIRFVQFELSAVDVLRDERTRRGREGRSILRPPRGTRYVRPCQLKCKLPFPLPSLSFSFSRRSVYKKLFWKFRNLFATVDFSPSSFSSKKKEREEKKRKGEKEEKEKEREKVKK